VAVFQDDFTGSNGDDLAGRSGTPGSGTWTQAGGTAGGAEINASNALKGVDTSAAGSGFTAPDTGSADHYAQGSIKNSSHSSFPLVIGLLNNANFRAGLRLAPNIQVWQRDTSTLTQLGGNLGIGTFSASDVWKNEGVGTTVTIYRNGVSVMTRTAAVHLTETHAGVVARSAAYDPWLDDFESGPVGGSDVTVTPGTGAVTAEGYAPTVAAGVTAAPGTGAVTAEGYAPTVAAGVTAAPGTGAVTVAGHAPTVSAASGVTVLPGVGAVTVGGYAPVVAAGVGLTPGVGAITVLGRAPTVTAGVTVTIGLGLVVVAGRAPSVAAGATPSEIPVRNAILSAIVAALNAAAITIDGDAVTVELGRTDAVPEGERPLIAVVGGDMVPTEAGDTLLQRYEMRVILAGYLDAATQAAAETAAGTLHAYAVRALVRPDPDAAPVSLLLDDGVTDVTIEERGMRIEPASVVQSEVPMADLAADFVAIVNVPYGSPFITA
jgi:hypothetical protein